MITDSFEIVFTKKVTFRDLNGKILKIYDVGDTCSASCEVKNKGYRYFVTSMGGIYCDEAKRLS